MTGRTRLQLQEGAQLVRMRFYGLSPQEAPLVYVERKTHHEKVGLAFDLPRPLFASASICFDLAPAGLPSRPSLATHSLALLPCVSL